MHPKISTYLDRADHFSAVVDGARDWDAASLCAEWSAADVLAHVLDTQRDFLADEELVGAEYDGYFGRTTMAATLADFYGLDLIAHRWDLGRATGQEVSFSDALEPSIAGFGDALYGEGVCARPVDVPSDAPRQDRIFGTLGRQP